MSIFGATTTPAPQAGGGLFGASNTQQQQPAGGLFGAPQNTTQPTNPNPLFGGNSATTTSNTSGGGLFGQSTNTNNAAQGGGLFGQQQQQQPAGAGGLFGSTQAQPAATGGGLFGATNSQQPAATSGGLFGASNQQTQQPAATGGGLFGSSTTQQPAAAGNSLFGAASNTTQPATGGGLFGASTSTQPTTGGGLFGAPSTTQPAPGGGLFGASSTTQPAAGGGLFGASNTTQPAPAGGLFGASSITQPATGGGLFGAPTTQPQQQQNGGGLFGGGSGGGLFGSKPGLNINTSTTGTAPTPNANPLFGGGAFGQSTTAAPAQTTTNSLFGGGSSTLGMSALGGSNQTGGLGNSILARTMAGLSQPQDPQKQHLQLQERIEGVYNAWSPASQQCRFQYAFYNIVDPSKVSQFQRPQNISNEKWEKARRENPDPSCLVPVFATGFDDLRARVDAQSAQSEKLTQRLTDVKKRLTALSERHTLSNISRLQRAAAQQIQVTQRLLALMQHIHLLIPALRSSTIRPEEERLRGQLEEVEEEIRRGRLAGKLNELWALIGAVAAATEKGRGGDGNGGEWAVVDEQGLAQIAQILADEQAGLAHLTKVLQKAQKDLGIILAVPGGSGMEDTGSFSDSSNSWGSGSTLRASALR